MKIVTATRFVQALATALLLTAGSAHAAAESASKVKFPAGLQWQPMALVAFDFPGFHEGTPAQRNLAMSVWGDTIKAMPVISLKDGGKYPSFVLLSGFDSGAYRYIFSSLSAAGAIYPQCEDPPNSSAPNTPMYSICPMRVVMENKATGQRSQQDFSGYCHLFVDSTNNPISKNHIDVAYDQRSNSAYFRAIQYGKHVPACDRSIRLN